MANVGSIDRTLRFIAGALLLVAAFLAGDALGAWRFALAAAGAVMIGTAAFRFCPAYTLLGIRTCPISKA
jgi:hypothetical protein